MKRANKPRAKTRSKKPTVDELDALARRRREQIARALEPREQLTFAPVAKRSLADPCPKCGHELGEHGGTRCPKSSTAGTRAAATAYYAPPQRELKRQRDFARRVMTVLSLRIDEATLAKIDQELASRAGEQRPMYGPSGWREKYQVNFRPQCRSSLILEAIDAWLNALVEHRRAA